MSYRELRLALSSKISLGNKLLDLDLVPREEDGRPADPDQQGIAHLFNVVSLALKPYDRHYLTQILVKNNSVSPLLEKNQYWKLQLAKKLAIGYPKFSMEQTSDSEFQSRIIIHYQVN